MVSVLALSFFAEHVTLPVPNPASTGSGPASRKSAFTTAFDATSNATEPRMVFTVFMDNPPLEGETFKRRPRFPTPSRRRVIPGRLRGEDKHPLAFLWPHFTLGSNLRLVKQKLIMPQVISRADFAEILGELVVFTKEGGPAADLRRG